MDTDGVCLHVAFQVGGHKNRQRPGMCERRGQLLHLLFQRSPNPQIMVSTPKAPKELVWLDQACLVNIQVVKYLQQGDPPLEQTFKTLRWSQAFLWSTII